MNDVCFLLFSHSLLHRNKLGNALMFTDNFFSKFELRFEKKVFALSSRLLIQKLERRNESALTTAVINTAKPSL
jgi:hypothetical protein